MTTSEMVRKLCEETGISISELARRIGQSPQNLNKKLHRETLTAEELSAIAEATGTQFSQEFRLSDGTRIGGLTSQPTDS